MEPSSEQREIIHNLKDNNIIIDAIAGAGKTSTVLFVAKEFCNKKVLVLTYNAQLKEETRKRAEDLCNLDVHSYHSFCVWNYHEKGYTDDVINQVIKKDSSPLNFFEYDIIIADEAQDMTPLFYKFLSKIFNDNSKRDFKIIIMGDPLQSIYKFREADARFITFSEQLFNKFNDYPWIIAKLSTTFRCPSSVTDFVNHCMLGYERMNPFKESFVKPDYIVCNSYGPYPKKIIKELLKEYKPSDIFIVAPSVKSSSSPVKMLANYVTNHLNTPIYFSGQDLENTDPKVIENKLVFTSIHQTKGRERKVVILFGFDSSYFDYFDKHNKNPTICPNEFYVAATRCRERLIMIHDERREYLPFIKTNKLGTYTKRNVVPKLSIHKPTSSTSNTFSVTELVSYIPFSVEDDCSNYFNINQIRDTGDKIVIPSTIECKYGYESVSDITGIAIPAYFEYFKTKNITLFSKNIIQEKISFLKNEKTTTKVIKNLERFSKTLTVFHKKHLEKIDMASINITKLLKICLYYNAQQKNTDYLLKQITVFNWLNRDKLKRGMERLKKEIKSENLVFEHSVDAVFNGTIIIGQIDCIDHTNKIIYEFKCTDNLNNNHLLQLALYMYMTRHKFKGYKYRLFNILTDEIKEIEIGDENLTKIMTILINNKLKTLEEKTNEEFLNLLVS